MPGDKNRGGIVVLIKLTTINHNKCMQSYGLGEGSYEML